jgi:subfamily B ATP-binding cassette protein MsbA
MAFFVPILGVVLKPDNPSSALPLFPFAPQRWQFDIHNLFPPALHIHNVLTVVALALVGSTVLKGICDYAGTYLVNYAGFGLITDLRNRLYEVIMRRSASFFHRHSTGTILSTLINDVDKVQASVSSVLGDFLQQFFTFLFTITLVIMLGGRLSWALLLFVPVVITSARRIGRSVQSRTRTGQDKLAEIQNILHETVTGHRIVKAFNTELWEILRFKNAAKRLFKANLRSVRIQSISSPLMDTIGSVAIALLLWLGRNEIQHGRMDASVFITFIIALFKLYDPVRRFASYYNSFQQALGASGSIFTFLEHRDDVKEKHHPKALS